MIQAASSNNRISLIEIIFLAGTNANDRNGGMPQKKSVSGRMAP
jgi:hypothetical protein